MADISVVAVTHDAPLGCVCLLGHVIAAGYSATFKVAKL